MTISEQQARCDIETIEKQMQAYLVKYHCLDSELNPKCKVYSTDTQNLSWGIIVGSVSLLVLALGLSCGSSYNFNLYNLILAYLHDEEARKEMNAAIEQWLKRQRPRQ